jgi:DNA-binding CsgD family transcriptional regulator
VRSDLVSVVEAAYELAPDEGAWLRGLIRRVAPFLDQGFGVSLSTYAPGRPPDESLLATLGMPEHVKRAMLGYALGEPVDFERTNTAWGSHRVVTFTQRMGLTLTEAARYRGFVNHMHPVGVKDFFGVLSLDPSGHAIWFGAPMPQLRRPTSRECSVWSRIAAHVAAGARLRRILVERPDALGNAEAVLSVSGRLEHAAPCAQGGATRDLLRQAVLRMDRARSREGRANSEEALVLWKALIAGRWSLVDRFDSGGRRYFVAHRNDPQVRDPRALSLRERQVLAYMASGDSLKMTAYSLGLSITSISRHRAAAMKKLGIRCSAEVLALFGPGMSGGPTPRSDHERTP